MYEIRENLNSLAPWMKIVLCIFSGGLYGAVYRFCSGTKQGDVCRPYLAIHKRRFVRRAFHNRYYNRLHGRQTHAFYRLTLSGLSRRLRGNSSD